MTYMTRDKAKMLRRVLEETFANHENKYKDYAINVGNASFDSQEVTFKVTLRIKDAERKEKLDLDNFAHFYDVEPQKIADVHGIKYQLVGYRVKARTKPFIVLNLQNNQEYVFTEDMGKRFFGKGEVA